VSPGISLMVSSAVLKICVPHQVRLLPGSVGTPLGHMVHLLGQESHRRLPRKCQEVSDGSTPGASGSQGGICDLRAGPRRRKQHKIG